MNHRNSFSILNFLLVLCMAWFVPPSRLHAEDTVDQFVEPYNSEAEPGDPMSPQEALQALQLPDGFRATVFAAEPDVRNPIAACTDAMGRVWVAENYTYAERSQRFDLNLSDRIVVLEDLDGNGIADRRRVFCDDLKVLTGLAVGRGGVWAMCPPQLLFIPDANQDLIPDGPPQVMLDGFHNARENYHNFANGLSWGPDGWLYGRCGASCPGEMGLPGAVDEDRVPIRGTMWRFHPERRGFEALAQGTTNPWGHDWNALGDLFFINTVNGHFWQCIPGAHYVRPHTLDVNPHVYELLDMHADHWHFDTGQGWTASRDGAANDYGGGHAHIGMVIYQEDTWPEQYHGKVMTVNMHGRRVNTEHLSKSGSGYVASHGRDFFVSQDPWFRGMELLPLPDGNLLVIDWSDTGECHEQTGVHRTSGRIFKVIYRGAEAAENPLADASVRADPVALADLQATGSTWVSRRARELLTELSLADTPLEPAIRELREIFLSTDKDVRIRLRALWALQCVKAIDEVTLEELFQSSEPALRRWGIRIVVDDWRLDTAYGNRPADVGAEVSRQNIDQLMELAEKESSAAVRLELASALQRLPLEFRSQLAQPLVAVSADRDDHNLPLMVWYGLSPLGEQHPEELLQVLEVCEWPVTRRLLARRIADRSKDLPEVFDAMYQVAASKDDAFQADVVLGTAEALAGWRQAERPSDWTSVASALADGQEPDLRSAIQNLNVLFGDGRTVEDLKRVVEDGKSTLELRMAALRSLVDAGANDTKSLCLDLLRTRFLNTIAAEGLAREQDPEIGIKIVEAYRRFHPSERSQAISVLTSRPAWAQALLTAVAEGKVDRSEISAFQARQMASLEDSKVSELLAEHWGQIRVSDEQKRSLIKALKQDLQPATLADADKQDGRRLFDKSCASCHMLFGEGGKIGPDLTGAQRSNLDYLLENIVDPSAVVTKEFRATLILLDDDRVLSGLVTEETENVVTLATQNEVFKLAKESIVSRKQTDQSTMPEGLLDQLSDTQVRNLFAYLQSDRQVGSEQLGGE